MEEKKEI